MLPRILEPELMDTPEEASDYDAMDHSLVNRVFAMDFLDLWTGDNPVLDLGAGTARIAIELCQQSSWLEVVGVDLAEHMLAVGRRNVWGAGLEGRIRLERGDAKALSYRDGRFGAVFSNSLIHHVPEPGRALAEMVRVVQPAGLLFVRDLLRPADEAELNELVSVYAGDANERQQALFRASLHAALTLEEVRALVTGLGFGAEGVQATSDRHWTWVARRT